MTSELDSRPRAESILYYSSWSSKIIQICIAISEDEKTTFLYEMKNETKVWSPSPRNIEILSNNFIERIRLRIVSNSIEEFLYKKIVIEKSKLM